MKNYLLLAHHDYGRPRGMETFKQDYDTLEQAHEGVIFHGAGDTGWYQIYSLKDRAIIEKDKNYEATR